MHGIDHALSAGLGVVTVCVAGGAPAEGSVVAAGAGVEDRWSQACEDLLRVLLGGDCDVDGELAEGDDDAPVGGVHAREAHGVVDDAVDGADGEHEAGDDALVVDGSGSRPEHDSACR